MSDASNVSGRPISGSSQPPNRAPPPVPRPTVLHAKAALEQRDTAQANAAPRLEGVNAKPLLGDQGVDSKLMQIFERSFNPGKGYSRAPAERLSTGYTSIPAARQTNYDKMPATPTNIYGPAPQFPTITNEYGKAPPSDRELEQQRIPGKVHVDARGVVSETYSRIPTRIEYGVLPTNVARLKDDIKNAGSDLAARNDSATLKSVADKIQSFDARANELSPKETKAAKKEINQLRKQLYKALLNHVQSVLAVLKKSPSKELAKTEFESAKSMFLSAGLLNIGSTFTVSKLMKSITELQNKSK